MIGLLNDCIPLPRPTLVLMLHPPLNAPLPPLHLVGLSSIVIFKTCSSVWKLACVAHALEGWRVVHQWLRYLDHLTLLSNTQDS